MAGTYYKYAERQADNQVNWFEIGKDLTDMLKKETETREAKKKAIDEASRQYGQELENAPQGLSDDVNKWTTDFAGDMQQYRLLTDRLLKSGQMKLKDYTLIRQNSLDGTKNLFNLSKEYQNEFATKTERRQNGESSVAETQFMAMVEGFANLGQTKALINPTTGAINVGKMTTGPNGVKVLAEGPDNYMTVNQLRQRIKEKINKYDLNTNLEGETKLLGDVVTEVVTKTGSATQTGFITKITDPTKRVGLSQEGQQAVDAYMKTEQQIVDAQLSNPFNTSSVLMDWTGGIDPKTKKPYQVTLDPEVAKSSSHYILFGYKNGTFQPDFESTPNGKAQQDEAATYVRNKLRSMLEQKKEVQAFSQPRKEYAPEYLYAAGAKKKEEQNALDLWQQIYAGKNTQAKEAAKQGLLGTPQAMQQGLLDIKMDGKTIQLVYADPIKNRPIKVIDELGNPMSGEDFAAAGTELHGVTDRTKYQKYKGQKYITEGVNWGGISAGRAGEPASAKPAIKEYLDTRLDNSLFSIKSKSAASKLASIVANFPGFKVEDVGGTFGNDVRLTAPDNTTFIFNANSPEKATEDLPALRDFIYGKVSEEKAKELLNTGALKAVSGSAPQKGILD